MLLPYTPTKLKSQISIQSLHMISTGEQHLRRPPLDVSERLCKPMRSHREVGLATTKRNGEAMSLSIFLSKFAIETGQARFVTLFVLSTCQTCFDQDFLFTRSIPKPLYPLDGAEICLFAKDYKGTSPPVSAQTLFVSCQKLEAKTCPHCSW